MPKYLIAANYTPEGAAGLMNEGGSGRVQAVRAAVEGLGGTIESFYFSFGETDAFVTVDVPDLTDVLALSMAVGASGRASTKTIALISPSEVDLAAEKTLSYRAPGE